MRKHSLMRKAWSVTLAAAMTLTSLPSTSFAAEESVVVDTTSEETSDQVVVTDNLGDGQIQVITTDNDVNPVVTETESAADVNGGANATVTGINETEAVQTETANSSQAETTPATDISAEAETEKSWQDEMAETGISSILPSDIDFSSLRLIVASDNASAVLDEENLLSEYDGIYLLQYDTISDVQTAYTYYAGAVGLGMIDFVDVDAEVRIAEVTGSNLAAVDEMATGNSQMEENANPIAELAEAMASSNPVAASNVIALIDTGVSSSAGVIDRVSMIGDDAGDNNGHGTDMLGYIREVNPDAQVVSIKAMDSNGVGNISSVYAAIKYAVEKNVKVINLSLSAYNTASNAAIKDAVAEAVANGIIVVGAAGNEGKNAKFFVPGSIAEAVIAGAADETGVRLATSNYGSTVDVNVVASSTSEAAAKLSAYISAHPDSVSRNFDANTNGLIFTTDYVPSAQTEAPAEDEGSDEAVDVVNDETDQVLIPDESEQVLIPDETDAAIDEISETETESETTQVLIPDEETEEETEQTNKYKVELLTDYMLYDITFDNSEDAMFAEGETVSMHVATNGDYDFSNIHIIPDVADEMEDSTLEIAFKDDEISFATEQVEKNGDSQTGTLTFVMPGYDVSVISDTFIIDETAKVTSDGQQHTMPGWQQAGKAAAYSTYKTVTYKEKTYTGFCLEPVKSAPVSTYEVKKVNDLITKALFYLYDGPAWTNSKYSYVQNRIKSAGSNNMAYYVATHYVLSYIYNPDRFNESSHGNVITKGVINSTGVRKIKEIVAKLAEYPMPSTSLTGKLKMAKTENERVYTTSVKYDSTLSSNTISFSVPEDDWVHIVSADGTTTVKKSGTATVKPGQSFYLSRPTSKKTKTQTFKITYKKFGTYKGFMLDTPASRQNVGFGAIPNASKNMSVSWETTYFNLTVHKSSAGAQYPFDGVTYGLYQSSNNAQLGTFVMNSDGTSNTITGLVVGEDYYVKELTTDNAGMYQLDQDIYTTDGTDAGQDGTEKLEVIEQTNGFLQLLKAPTYPECSAGNEMYSLEGATYKITDAAGNDVFTTTGVNVSNVVLHEYDSGNKTSDGRTIMYAQSNVIGPLAPGVYYAQEVTAPKGYDTDPDTHAIVVTSANDQSNPAKVEGDFIYEKEVMDPLGITLVKKNAQPEKTDQTVVEPIEPIGAIFQVDYYDKFYDTVDQIDKKPTRTWYLKTEKVAEGRYEASFNNLTGDSSPLYLNEAGDPQIPYGTVVIREAKAPDNFTLYGSEWTDGNKNSATMPYLSQITKASDRITLKGRNEAGVVATIAELPLAMKTKAVDIKLESQYTSAETLRSISDIVTIDNTYSEISYILAGELIDEESGEIVATAVSEKFNGAKKFKDSIEQTVTFDEDTIFTAYAGKTLLVNEYLFHAEDEGKIFKDSSNKKAGVNKDVAIAYHYVSNMTEEEKANQRIQVADFSTTAVSGNTDDKSVPANETAQVVDTIAYTNLEPDREYTVRGQIMEVVKGEDGTLSAKEIEDKNGLIKAESTFKAEKAKNGTTTLTFDFDATDMRGKTLVVFEKIYTKNTSGEEDLIRTHEDPNDKDQTVYVPDTITEAKDVKDADENTHQALAEEKTQIADTITFDNVVVGYEYTVHGNVMLQSDGSEIPSTVVGYEAGEGAEISTEEKDGETIYKFTATATTGYVVMTFEFDSKYIEGESSVIFEDIDHKGKEAVVHHDLKSKPQTTTIPKLRTTAISEDTEDQITGPNAETFIQDTIHYENLSEEYTYHFVGSIVDKASKEVVESIMVDEEGNEIEYVEFTPADEDQAKEGDVIVRFKVDTTGMEEHTLVVFEKATLAATGKVIGLHEDINDTDQSIFIPGVITTVNDAVTNTNHTLAEEKAVVEDTVYYTNLVAGYTYTVYGTLHDQKDETVAIASIMVDEEGNEIDGYTFTVPEDAEKNELGGVDGSVVIRMQFDAKAIEGTTIVAFERLDHTGKEIAVHADIKDKPQTEYVPKLRTTATDDKTKEHLSFAEKDTTLTDVVAYEGLEVGRTYRLYGKVMQKVKGENGEVTGVEVPSSMFIGGDEEETADKQETESESETEAKEAESEAKDSEEKEPAKADDGTQNTEEKTDDSKQAEGTGSENAADDKKADGSESKTVNKPEKGSKVDYVEFVPTTRNGSIKIHLAVDTSALEGSELVVFETMSIVAEDKTTGEDGKETTTEREEIVGKHEDLTDESQTISVPKISTTATADDTQTHETQAAAKTVITDVVKYENLVPGKTYLMTGTLYSKTTGKPFVTADQKPFTQETEFTPESANGEVSLSFEISTQTLAGKSIVVFEECAIRATAADESGKETPTDITVAVHQDINDTDQTVTIVDLKTTATDKKTGTHEVEEAKQVSVVDRVQYTGLTVGKEYTVQGTLMDKETGKALAVGGKAVTATAKFTAKEAEGSVDLTFTFDGSKLAGKSVVAFEDLYNGETKIATHSDLNDENQTVTIIKISTKLADANGKQSVDYGETVTLTDRVTYSGLTIGKSYTVRGELMDKTTKKGTGITAETTFTPDNASGYVDLDFSVDTTQFAEKSLVAFEKLYNAENVLVASHEDIEDKDQTVTVGKKPNENTPGSGDTTKNNESDDSAKQLNKPTTGDTTPVGAYAALTLAALAAVLIVLIARKKKAQKK